MKISIDVLVDAPTISQYMLVRIRNGLIGIHYHRKNNMTLLSTNQNKWYE